MLHDPRRDRKLSDMDWRREPPLVVEQAPWIEEGAARTAARRDSGEKRFSSVDIAGHSAASEAQRLADPK